MRQKRVIVRSGLADQVYEALSEQILDMEYAPGERLVIDQIARDLAVSGTPVRDALTRLAAERLIESTPFRGFTALPDPTPAEIAQSFEAREAIETFAVRLGCERASESQIEELDELQAVIAAKPYTRGSGSFSTFVRLNQRFHELVVETSANRCLVDALRGLYHDALVARTMHGRGVPDLDYINEEHAAIVQGFAARDLADLEAAVVRHIRDGARRVLEARSRVTS
jgi:DNA-binding GntR family transcriptional regulator